MSAATSLLWAWMRRDLGVRYTQTLLGGSWAVVQPLALTAAFVFVFQGVARVQVGIPYIVFVYVGMVLWTLVSNGLTMAASSMANSMYIASKASYPRVVAPTSATLLGILDVAIGLLPLPILMWWQGAALDFDPLPLVGAVFGALLFTLGAGAALAALVIFVRDVRLVLPFVLQVGVLLTPIAYDAERRDLPSVVGAVFRWNPLATYVAGFRAGWLDYPAPATADWARALTLSVVVAVAGLLYFQRVQERFPDVA